jgi:hypothetical protein
MSRALGWLSRRFRPLAVLVSGAGLGLVLWTERSAIGSFPWRLSWPLFLLAIVTLAGGPLFGATSFWLVAGSPRYLPTLRLWMRAFLARYVPLGALTVAVRLRGRGSLDVSRADMLSATVYEQVAAVLGGATAATVSLSLTRGGLAAVPATFVAGAAGAAVALRLLARRLRLQPVPARALAAASATACVGWASAGTGVWLLMNALSRPAPTLVFATGAYALAWLVGFVVPFAPSGLGAREATLIGLLAPRFGVGPAATVAVVVRFANVVGDLVAAGAVEAATHFGYAAAYACGSVVNE